MNIFEQLSHPDLHLNQTEQRVIEYILENFEQFEDVKIQKISNDLFISPNTIIRLCKKLGYDGFSRLKHNIIHTNMREKSTPNVHYGLLDLIDFTMSINSAERIRDVAKTIHESDQLIIFGFGLSQFVANDLARKLTHLDKLVIVPDDRDNCKLFANNLREGQVAMIISLSGDTDIIKKISSIVKTKNVPAITITGFGQNLVSTFGTLNLFGYYNRLEIHGSDVSSRFGFYILTELIFQECYELYKQNQK